MQQQRAEGVKTLWSAHSKLMGIEEIARMGHAIDICPEEESIEWPLVFLVLADMCGRVCAEIEEGTHKIEQANRVRSDDEGGVWAGEG